MLPNLSALRQESAPTGVEPKGAKPKGAKGKAKKQKKQEEDVARNIQDTWDEVRKMGDANDMMNPLTRLLRYDKQDLTEEVRQFLLQRYANAQKLSGCNRRFRGKPKGMCDEDYKILIKDLRKLVPSPDLFRGGPWD